MKFPIAFIVIAFLLACGSVHAAGPNGIQVGQPLNDSGQIILDDTMAQAVADSGAGWVRLGFRLGPYQSDTSDWYSIYDGIVDRLRSRGIEIIGLCNDEMWHGSSTDWNANNYEQYGGNGWNPYLNNLSQVFLRIATHWQGKIKYWELWNEPDCLAVIKPSNFGAYLANSYDLIHTNNIPVYIISGGLCTAGYDFGSTYLRNTYDVSINHTLWFKQMKDKWGTYPLDFIGYHCYPNPHTPLDKDGFSALMDGVHQAYVDYEGSNTTKKMIITELGWQSTDVSEAQQASNLTDAYSVMATKPYLKTCTWFFLKDIPVANLYFGIFRSTGLGSADKKPAWTNFKIANTYEGMLSAGGQADQPILNYYNYKGHVNMGNPYDNGSGAWVRNWDYGNVQDYDGGNLGKMLVCDSSDGIAYSIQSNFLSAAQASHTTLEFPLGDQFFTGSGYKQNFEGGYVVWTQSGGAQVTPYANKLILDNSNTGFTASSSWAKRLAVDAYPSTLRDYVYRTGTATNTDPAVWTIPVPTAGYYDVYVRYPTITGAAAAAEYDIMTTTGIAAVKINQQTRTARWNHLGTFSFAAGSAVISLSSQAGSTEYVIADAVRLIGPVAGGSDTTPPTIPVVTDEGAYTSSSSKLTASWQSADLESGMNHFEYAIGTSPTDTGAGYLVPWTSTGTANSVTKTVTLTPGSTYYFYVKAYNNAGLWSEGVSDGIKVDVTPPTRPIVTADGDYTGDTSLLHFMWSATDPESGISGYEYSVGTTAQSGDIVPLTNAGLATQVWVTGLQLTPGQSYYLNVRATNGAGVKSYYNYATAIRCQSALSLGLISDILGMADGATVLLKNKMVSASFANCFYLEEMNRCAGIAVMSSKNPPEGSLVDVTGILSTINGQRVLNPGAVTPVQP